MNETRFDPLPPDTPLGYSWKRIERIFEHRPALFAEFQRYTTTLTLAHDPETMTPIIKEGTLRAFLMGETKA